MTYQYLKLLQAQEGWVDLKVHDEDAPSTRHQHDKLVLLPRNDVPFAMRAREFAEYIAPSTDMFGGAGFMGAGNSAAAAADSAASSAAASFRSQGSFGAGGVGGLPAPASSLGLAGGGMLPVTGSGMPTFGGPGAGEISDEALAARALQLLLAARVASTRQIVAALGVKTVEMLEMLVVRMTRFAYIVQGNWVVKSESLYDLKRVPAEYRRLLTRNMAISAFGARGKLTRDELYEATSAEPEVMNQVLAELGVRGGERGLMYDDGKADTDLLDQGEVVFKMARDNDFLHHFPDLASAQVKVLEALETQTRALLVPYKQ